MAKHVFAVVGHGQFPMDMLRYDFCRPRSADDSEAISLNVSELRARDSQRIVWLVSDESRPTVARWASFGWTVLSHDQFGYPLPVADVETIIEATHH